MICCNGMRDGDTWRVCAWDTWWGLGRARTSYRGVGERPIPRIFGSFCLSLMPSCVGLETRLESYQENLYKFQLESFFVTIWKLELEKDLTLKISRVKLEIFNWINSPRQLEASWETKQPISPCELRNKRSYIMGNNPTHLNISAFVMLNPSLPR